MPARLAVEMAGRTFAVGDVHGETQHLFRLMSCLPALDPEDTLVFLGDYVDRGPRSKQVVEYIRRLPSETPARVIALRGNHEDAWLRVIDNAGWQGFTGPPGNGCLAALRSYMGGLPARDDEFPAAHEQDALHSGSFFDEDHIAWFRTLPFWHEDEHAIYVHAGLPMAEGGHFPHPSEVTQPLALLWCRDMDFFQKYRGKRVVFGHTRTEFLPPELDGYSPQDPTDIWAGDDVVGIDTGCGNGGFLTALELPTLNVYESR